MPLRNGPHGYGLVTKLLHWATVAALAAQFVVGYVMLNDDGGFEEALTATAGPTGSRSSVSGSRMLSRRARRIPWGRRTPTWDPVTSSRAE